MGKGGGRGNILDRGSSTCKGCMVRKYMARRGRKKASVAGAKSIGNPCYKRRLGREVDTGPHKAF